MTTHKRNKTKTQGAKNKSAVPAVTPTRTTPSKRKKPVPHPRRPRAQGRHRQPATFDPLPESDAFLVKEDLRQEVVKYRRQLEIIRQASLRMTTELSLDQILNGLVVTAKEFFNADAVSCMHWDDSKSKLIIKAGIGFKTDYTHKRVIPAQRLKPIIDSGYDHFYLENIQLTAKEDVQLIHAEQLVSELTIFLRYGQEMLGAINIYSRGRIRHFTQEEMENAHFFAQQAAIAVRNANLYKEMKEEAQIAKTLLQVAEEVGALNSLDDVTTRLMIILHRSLKVKIGMIFLWNQGKKLYLPSKAVGLPPHRSPLFQTLILRQEDVNFTEEELSLREVICAQKEPGRFPIEKIANVLLERDLYFVPLVTKGKLLGAIAVAGYQGKQDFNHKDEVFLRGIAAEAAIAIDDASLFEALEGAFWDIIKSLAAAIEVKDSYTHSHSESVINYATAIAQELKLVDTEIDLLNKACLLHDLGKIGIDDSILQKVAPLTFYERKNIERHPVIGSQILQSVGSLADVAIIVRHHHEKYDGSGYPDRLAGENIPRLARILAVADSFDAMTSDRPYRKALNLEQAVEELKTCSGRQFDPELVEIFLRVLQRKKVKWGLALPPAT
ncbi:HD domain-containing protein [candidate division FCPU426 bacterium]|nr:HD domain-containing protein [candidate division FCPU426 bacterium]